MRGKDTCKTLKEIRKNVAEKNGIPLEVEECTYEGDCSGTCPKCEAELAELERALAEKEARGETVDRTADIEPPEKRAAPKPGLGEEPPIPEPLCGLIMPPPEEPRGERRWKRESDISEPLLGHLMPSPDIPRGESLRKQPFDILEPLEGEPAWPPENDDEDDGEAVLMGEVEAPEKAGRRGYSSDRVLRGSIYPRRKRTFWEKLRSFFRRGR